MRLSTVNSFAPIKAFPAPSPLQGLQPGSSTLAKVPGETCELTSPTAAIETPALKLTRVDPLEYWQEHKPPQDAVLIANAVELESSWQKRLGPGEGKCLVGIQVDPAWLKKNPETGKTFVYLDELADAVIEAGGVPKLLFPERGDLESQRQGLGCLLNSGGGDIDPSFWGEAPKEGTNKTLNAFRLSNTKWALDSNLPFLGLCLGNQELAVADGGKLEDIRELGGPHMTHWNDESAKKRELRAFADHEINVKPTSSIAKNLGPLTRVNSIHNWAVSAACPGATMAVVAFSIETNPTPEALERVGNPQQRGLQFHPEFMRWNPETHGQHQSFFNDLVRDGTAYAESKGIRPPQNPNYPAANLVDGFMLLN